MNNDFVVHSNLFFIIFEEICSMNNDFVVHCCAHVKFYKVAYIVMPLIRCNLLWRAITMDYVMYHIILYVSSADHRLL